ncbi:hypothetical protein C8R45DRAFT_928136 [Mycena sanguinolenta]|nr:hypothetical protein C8R45DRAFT_928136 [Mycena sanguinolenta]
MFATAPKKHYGGISVYGRRELRGSIQIELRGSSEPRSSRQPPEIPGLRSSALFLLFVAVLDTCRRRRRFRQLTTLGILSLYDYLPSFRCCPAETSRGQPWHRRPGQERRKASGTPSAAATGVEDSNKQVGEETRKRAEPRSPGISGGWRELRGSLEPRSSI